MLSHLKSIAEASQNATVVNCVVSVPSYFTDSQRRALLESCSIAQLNCKMLMNDTTAAALAYSIYQEDLPRNERNSQKVVFVDLGYSSLQVAVLAKSFDPTVGGKYFDECLVNYFAKEFKNVFKIDSLANPRHRLRLTIECEKLKKQLSSSTATLPLIIETFVNEKDVISRIDRNIFKDLCAELFKKIEMTLKRVLKKACLTNDDIHSVVTIGGSCRIPAVKEIITSVFNKPCNTVSYTDEIIARGCASQCALLNFQNVQGRKFKITDIYPYTIKLSCSKHIDESLLRFVIYALQYAC
ncbi:heat shock 70 kDa protein 4L-like [Dysidea avara]|uniref:heat shock 70 kDa protein 4L-like n=1 Tax=Dysidea avara TaxID=196820 RepID=UPI003322D51A